METETLTTELSYENLYKIITKNRCSDLKMANKDASQFVKWLKKKDDSIKLIIEINEATGMTTINFAK